MAIPAEAFFFAPHGEGTLQQQLQRLIADGILSGRFRPGERLPSSRGLAKHLGVSRITVTLAYTDLVANDYLTAKGRSGYYVSDDAPQSPHFEVPQAKGESHVNWSRALTTRYADVHGVERPADWQRYPYPFIYGQTDPRLFDHHSWRQCALQALGARDFTTLTADAYHQDDPMLVEYIQRHILPRRGIAARQEQILITMGAQNALWIAAQVLLGPRRTAVMENPGYPVLRDILTQTQCRSLSLPVDADGLDPEQLPEETDVLFATVSHHCPTNATLPMERRRALLERAWRDNFLIVEDDYEVEMSFLGSPKPALKAMDQGGSVIYVGSFSKSLFPGLRLGFIVAEEPFIREARGLRGLVLRHPPGHVQRTAAYFLSLGYYDAQVSRMARAYRRRRGIMEAAIAEHGLDVAGAGQGGSCFWMRSETDTSALAARLKDDGVLIEAGAAFFAPETPDARHYRISYSSVSSERIPEGIRRIALASLG